MKRHTYRITPSVSCSSEEWTRADSAINGMDHRRDFNEAIALAKLFSVNAQAPFDIEMIMPPYRGRKVIDCIFWQVNP